VLFKRNTPTESQKFTAKS